MNAGIFRLENDLEQMVFHKGKYRVSFKRNVDDIKKDVNITIEKIYQQDSLKITLSDDDDPCFLCMLLVTRGDYEELKRQQGLLVDFDNFPAQLLRLLQQTSSGNIFLVLLQNNPLQMYLEFIEHNEFKRLVHLSLKTSAASDGDLRKNMADNIINLKKIVSNLKSKNSSNEAAWSDMHHAMEKKIHDQASVIARLEETSQRREIEHQKQLKKERDSYMQEKHELQKCADASLKSQLSSLQDALTRKEIQLDDLNEKCRQYHDCNRTLEQHLCDKNQRIQHLEKQAQLCGADLEISKIKCNGLERDLHEKEKNLQMARQKKHENDKILKDKNDKLDELYDLIQSLKRDKIRMEEKLAQIESISTKHNIAVQTSSEQLLKANQIIAKQNSDLLELKEKLLCRTAIALEQEKVIEKNTDQMADLHEKSVQLNAEKDKLSNEVLTLKGESDTMNALLKEKNEIIKDNNLVINWLQTKEDRRLGPISNDLNMNVSKPNRNFANAASFLKTIRSLDSSRSKKENDPGSMINYYDTSDCADDLNSPQEFTARSECATTSKYSIDPKFLKPSNGADKGATTDRSLKSSLSTKSTAKSVKFSQRPVASTSRSASAYFPPK